VLKYAWLYNALSVKFSSHIYNTKTEEITLFRQKLPKNCQIIYNCGNLFLVYCEPYTYGACQSKIKVSNDAAAFKLIIMSRETAKTLYFHVHFKAHIHIVSRKARVCCSFLAAPGRK
jgi:hypothetical protein